MDRLLAAFSTIIPAVDALNQKQVQLHRLYEVVKPIVLNFAPGVRVNNRMADGCHPFVAVGEAILSYADWIKDNIGLDEAEEAGEELFDALELWLPPEGLNFQR